MRKYIKCRRCVTWSRCSNTVLEVACAIMMGYTWSFQRNKIRYWADKKRGAGEPHFAAPPAPATLIKNGSNSMKASMLELFEKLPFARAPEGAGGDAPHRAMPKYPLILVQQLHVLSWWAIHYLDLHGHPTMVKPEITVRWGRIERDFCYVHTHNASSKAKAWFQ